MGDAFEVYAFDYQLKPFKVERVIQTLERARDRINRREEKPLPAFKPRNQVTAGRLMLHHRDGVGFLNMQDILLVQREERATVIYTVNDGRFVTSDSLGYRGKAGSQCVLPVPQILYHQPEPHQGHHSLRPLDVCGTAERHPA
jgi:hypothetical protein